MNWTPILVAIGLVMFFAAMRRASLISAAEARDLLEKSGAVVVDVRTAEEFASGHLEGAVNLPLGDVAALASKRFPDKGSVLLLHCVSGGRSAMARAKLRSLGYDRAYNLGSYGRAAGIAARDHGRA